MDLVVRLWRIRLCNNPGPGPPSSASSLGLAIVPRDMSQLRTTSSLDIHHRSPSSDLLQANLYPNADNIKHQNCYVGVPGSRSVGCSGPLTCHRTFPLTSASPSLINSQQPSTQGSKIGNITFRTPSHVPPTISHNLHPMLNWISDSPQRLQFLVPLQLFLPYKSIL